MNVLPDTQRHLLLFKSSMTFQIEGNDLYLKFLENEQAGSKGYLFVMNGWENSRSRLQSIVMTDNYNYRVEKDYGLVKVPPIHGWTEFWIRITKENRFQVGRGTNFHSII
jgi:hypothetical protein